MRNTGLDIVEIEATVAWILYFSELRKTLNAIETDIALLLSSPLLDAQLQTNPKHQSSLNNLRQEEITSAAQTRTHTQPPRSHPTPSPPALASNRKYVSSPSPSSYPPLHPSPLTPLQTSRSARTAPPHLSRRESQTSVFCTRHSALEREVRWTVFARV